MSDDNEDLTGERHIPSDGTRIGYRNPPRHSRFRKGRSGNPKGRPKRDVPPDSIEDQQLLRAFLRHADHTVTVREGDRRTTLPMREVLNRAIWARASKGDTGAMRLASDMLQRAEKLEAERIAADNVIWKDYIAACALLDRHAAANGDPPPRHIPHPEDIILEAGKEARFKIPPDEESYRKIEETSRFRDLLLLQGVLDERRHLKTGDIPFDYAAFCLASFVNEALPTRMQLDFSGLYMEQWRYRHHTKRQIVSLLRKGWKRAGIPHPHIWTTPPIEKVKQTVEAFCEALKIVFGKEREGDIHQQAG